MPFRQSKRVRRYEVRKVTSFKLKQLGVEKPQYLVTKDRPAAAWKGMLANAVS